MSFREAPKLPHVQVSIGHHDLYGTKLSFDDAGQLLEGLDPEYVLAACGYLSAVAVQDENDANHARFIAETLQLLFPPDRIERFESRRKREAKRGAQLTVVGEHTLTALARIALLKARGSLQPFSGIAWQKKISSALLAVNDFANEPASVSSGSLDGTWTADQNLTALRMFLPQHAGTYNEDSWHAFARAKRMFLELPREMHDDHEWIDFTALVEKKFGISTRDLLMCSSFLFFAFATQTHSRGPRSVPIRVLAEVLRVDQRVADVVMQLYSQTFDEAANAEQKLMTDKERFETFDARTFLKKPVVRFEDRMIAPNHRFLFRQANISLYYTLLDALPDEKKNSQAFFNFTGRIFERYCDDLATRIATATGSRYIAQPLQLRVARGTEGKNIDGALVETGGTITLLEYKGGMLNVFAGMHAEEAAFTKAFDSIVIKAVTQLRDTIRAIREGAVIGEGANQPRFALVVTHFPFPNNFMLDAVVKDRMAARNESMSEFADTPLLFMHVSEFERLEPILAARGWRLSGLLDCWARHHPRISFHNFHWDLSLNDRTKTKWKRNPLLEACAREWLDPWFARVNELADQADTAAKANSSGKDDVVPRAGDG